MIALSHSAEMVQTKSGYSVFPLKPFPWALTQSNSLYIKRMLMQHLYIQVHILKECNKASISILKELAEFLQSSDSGQR